MQQAQSQLTLSKFKTALVVKGLTEVRKVIVESLQRGQLTPQVEDFADKAAALIAELRQRGYKVELISNSADVRVFRTKH